MTLNKTNTLQYVLRETTVKKKIVHAGAETVPSMRKIYFDS